MVAPDEEKFTKSRSNICRLENSAKRIAQELLKKHPLYGKIELTGERATAIVGGCPTVWRADLSQGFGNASWPSKLGCSRAGGLRALYANGFGQETP
jgi:hypothetical protein